MDHAEAELLVALYADAELDPITAQRFESHLPECEICAGALRRLIAGRVVLGQALERGPTPAALRAKILNDVRKAARREGDRRPTPVPWMRYAASIVATVLLTSAATFALTRHPGVDLVAETVLNDHLRALATHQMTDVASSDQHTVKPWFDGRLSYAPPVRDLKDKGFTLLGGRVDYIDGQGVAVLVYGRRLHLVSLFLRPLPPDQRPAASMTVRRGFNIVQWTAMGFTYCAVSDVSAEDLLQLKKLLGDG